MGEIISFADIHKKFNSEWILLADPEIKDGLKVKRGKLLCHSKDRDEVYRKARELKPKHSAIFYTGKLPHDTVIVL